MPPDGSKPLIAPRLPDACSSASSRMSLALPLPRNADCALVTCRLALEMGRAPPYATVTASPPVERSVSVPSALLSFATARQTPGAVIVTGCSGWTHIPLLLQ